MKSSSKLRLTMKHRTVADLIFLSIIFFFVMNSLTHFFQKEQEVNHLMQERDKQLQMAETRSS